METLAFLIVRGGLDPIYVIELGQSKPVHARLLVRALQRAVEMASDERKDLAGQIGDAVARALGAKQKK